MRSSAVGSGATVGLWRRLLAFAYDYIVIAVYLTLTVLAGVLLTRFLPQTAARLFETPGRSQFVAFLIVTLPVTLYFAVGNASIYQGTWGKRRLHLRVSRPDGQRLSMGRSLWRTVLKFVPWELAHTAIWQLTAAPDAAAPLMTVLLYLVWGLVFLNLFLIWRTPTHQALYDRLAQTIVTSAADQPA